MSFFGEGDYKRRCCLNKFIVFIEIFFGGSQIILAYLDSCTNTLRVDALVVSQNSTCIVPTFSARQYFQQLALPKAELYDVQQSGSLTIRSPFFLPKFYKKAVFVKRFKLICGNEFLSVFDTYTLEKSEILFVCFPLEFHELKAFKT